MLVCTSATTLEERQEYLLWKGCALGTAGLGLGTWGHFAIGL